VIGLATNPASPLRDLLRSSLFRRWAVANLFARLPLTMNLLALVLVGEAVTGSLATGATLAGILTFTTGVLAQPRGRRLDRSDLRAGLRRALLLSALVMAALVVAVVLRAPVWVLGVLAAAEGVASAAILGGFRALLVPTVTAEQIEPANALDAVFVEVAFVAGPAVAGGAALIVGPVGVLIIQTAAFVIAAALLAGLPTRLPVDDLRRAGPAPLRTRGAGSVYVIALGLGLCLGAWEATMPARLESFGLAPASAGPLLALTAFGSGVAGLVAANQRDPLRRGRVVTAVLLVAFAVVLVPSAIAPNLILLGVALFAVGLPIAPLNALGGLTLQRTVAVPRQAEGFSLFPAMILIGAGAGQVVAGQLLRVLTPSELIQTLAVVPAAIGVLVIAATIRRRLAGMPPGVGYPYDPNVANPEIHIEPQPA
jgi:MFS family permease